MILLEVQLKHSEATVSPLPWGSVCGAFTKSVKISATYFAVNQESLTPSQRLLKLICPPAPLLPHCTLILYNTHAPIFTSFRLPSYITYNRPPCCSCSFPLPLYLPSFHVSFTHFFFIFLSSACFIRSSLYCFHHTFSVTYCRPLPLPFPSSICSTVTFFLHFWGIKNDNALGFHSGTETNKKNK